MTVGEVHRKYVLDYPSGKLQGLADLSSLICADINSIKAFLDPSDDSVEDTLHLA